MKAKNTNTKTAKSSRTKTTTTKTSKRQFATSLKCNKDWFTSNKVRPKTIIIVAERTQDGYRIENATVRVAVNQHSRTVIPVDNLKDLVQDMNQRGIRI
jgi:hypothetical protein